MTENGRDLTRRVAKVIRPAVSDFTDGRIVLIAHAAARAIHTLRRSCRRLQMASDPNPTTTTDLLGDDYQDHVCMCCDCGPEGCGYEGYGHCDTCCDRPVKGSRA